MFQCYSPSPQLVRWGGGGTLKKIKKHNTCFLLQKMSSSTQKTSTRFFFFAQFQLQSEVSLSKKLLVLQRREPFVKIFLQKKHPIFPLAVRGRTQNTMKKNKNICSFFFLLKQVYSDFTNKFRKHFTSCVPPKKEIFINLFLQDFL
jgi:hypothetical protein